MFGFGYGRAANGVTELSIMLYSEVNLLCIVMIGIILVSVVRFRFDSSAKKITLVCSISFAIAANVLDMLWNLLLGVSDGQYATLQWAIDLLHFMSFGIASWFWYWYEESLRGVAFWKHRRRMLVSLVPLAVLLSLLIATYFNGCLFRFEEDGTYVRGPLFYLQQILAYSYMLLASVKTLWIAFAGKKHRRDECWAALIFGIPPILFGVLQIIFQSIPVISVGVMVSYLVTFINYMQLVISIDPLTEISNRRGLLQRLDAMLESQKRERKLYLLFMNVDSFKQINDLYGHDFGDAVLKNVANAITSLCTKTSGICGRYGGDEFVMLQPVEKGGDIGDVLGKLHETIAEQCKTEHSDCRVALSVGTAEYQPDSDTAETLLARADAEMYENKRRKKATAKQGNVRKH